MSTVQSIILYNSFLGLAAGFIMHRADFCLAGMFRDLFLFKTTFKLRILLLLIFTSMVLFEASRLCGIIRLYPFPLFGSPALTIPLGGALFGIGMVLAGGCVVGSLYKTGAGSLPSLVALAGLIAGSAIYAELFPWWSKVFAASTILKGKITMAQALGISPTVLIAIATAVGLPWVYNVQRRGGWVRPAYAEGTLQPWLAALLLAVIGLISVLSTGIPLGIATTYAKAAAVTEAAVAPGHYDGLQYFRTMPVQLQHPVTGDLLSGGPGKQLDAVALIQYPLVIGIVAGSAVSALLLRELRFRWRAPLRQYLSAAAGGILMGLASRMATGCNVWHLLGGLPILSLQSMLFLAGLIPGAWFGARLLTRYVVR